MSGVFGGKKEPPPPPPPPPTPIVDEEAIKKAKDRALRRQSIRGGRASTVLGGALDDNQLGG